MLLTAALCIFMCSAVFATDGFIKGNITPELEDNEFGNSMSSAVSDFLGILQWVCWGIAVGMIMYIGIKYMAASANERADLKSSLYRYVVGALLIALTSTIFNAVWDFVTSI